MVATRPNPQPHLQPSCSLLPLPTTSLAMLNFWPFLWAVCLSFLGVDIPLGPQIWKGPRAVSASLGL